MWDDECKQSISADLPEQKECIEMGGSEGGFVLLGFVRQIASVHYSTDSSHFLCERIEICRVTAAFFNEVCQKS